MYGFHTTFNGSVVDAVSAVTVALSEAGFGVLTEIDVQATLKKKLNIERSAYRILGACNPQLAHQALEADPDIGLLLPCNVIVREEADGSTTVGFIEPAAMLGVTGRSDLVPLADEVKSRLERVRDALTL
jgi:uncharacterized protein (DUF302 family)